MWRNPFKELKPHFYSDFVLLYIIFFLVPRNLILEQLHVCKHELFCHKNWAEAEPRSERSGAPNENIGQNHINIALLNVL